MVTKRSSRLLLGVLFLLVSAVATLCLRIIISGAGVDIFILNDTVSTQKALLKFAERDLSEDSLKQNVEQLLNTDFKTDETNRRRPFLTGQRYRFDIGARSITSNPMDLRSPEWSKSRRYLQNWWRHRHFDPDVLSNMVNVFPTANMTGGKYKTCAVVGNSGILLKSNLGEAIDSHEFVIRLNNARTDGYERFVGSKTSLSFMNSNILHLCSRRNGCFCHPYGYNVPIMMYISQPIHFLDYALCSSSHKSPLMVTDPQLDILCARIVKYYSVKRFMKETTKPLEAWASAHGGIEFHYSSGMQAVMVALGMCEKVSIFGFGKTDSAKHHYHTNQMKELGLHDYQAEYDFYQDLVNKPEVIPFVSDKFEFPPAIIHR